MVPNNGWESSFLEKICFLKNPISVQIESKSNPNLIYSLFPSTFFLYLQGQHELCGSYHLLQFCFLSSSISMANLRHLVTASFSSLALFSSVFTVNPSCLLATTFSSFSILSNSFSSPRFNLLRVARCCFSWSSVSDDLFFSSCSYLVLLLALSFSRLILSLSVLCSSVSEALFAWSFSFLIDCFRPC